jgi:hypothetical protein
MAKVSWSLVSMCVVFVIAATPALAARALSSTELASTAGGGNRMGCVKVGCGEDTPCCMLGSEGCVVHNQCGSKPRDCNSQDTNEDMGECQQGGETDDCEMRPDFWCIKYKIGTNTGGACSCGEICQMTFQDGCIVPEPPPPPPPPPGP